MKRTVIQNSTMAPIPIQAPRVVTATKLRVWFCVSGSHGTIRGEVSELYRSDFVSRGGSPWAARRRASPMRCSMSSAQPKDGQTGCATQSGRSR